MDKRFKDILPDKDLYHNRGRDQTRKKRGGVRKSSACGSNAMDNKTVFPEYMVPTWSLAFFCKVVLSVNIVYYNIVSSISRICIVYFY
jgi:hypothetical protein